MDVVKVDSDIITNRYHKGIMQLVCASHWVCGSTGEWIKLPQGLKIYYQYRYKMYNSFSQDNKPYLESHITVAKMLGLSSDTVKRTYNPLLKRMGLVETHGSYSDNNVTYIVNPPNRRQGYLVNEHLKGRDKLKFDNNEKIDYAGLKILERNKKKADYLYSDSKSDKEIIDRKELMELRKIKRMYEQGE